MQCQRPGAETTEIEARMATSGLCFYGSLMAGCSQAVKIQHGPSQVGRFNHRVVAMVADKLRRQWFTFGIRD